MTFDKKAAKTETMSCNFKPLTLVIVILLAATLVLFILNHDYYFPSEEAHSEELVQLKAHHDKNHLKPLRLDMAKFEMEVIKPHKDMRAKFPHHPEMIINKLFKLLRKEENRTASLLEKVIGMKTALGVRTEIDAEESFQRRKLKSVQEEDLPLCPEKSPYLLGPLYVKQNDIPNLEVGTAKFERHFGTTLRSGGASRPQECLARTKLAVIIAFRNREEHLSIFLHHMHPIFQRQLLDYRIFVVEQTPKEDFNRGALMNIGYTEALKVDNFDCFVFHDVDLVPEDDRNIYECPSSGPKHMSTAVNKWKYRLQYLNYFGGVTAMSKDQFKNINGFANNFYGWGGEDDDLNHRMQVHDYKLNRNPGNIARFIMLKHDKVAMNDDLENLMEKSKNSQLDSDGLATLKYTKVDEKMYPLYTWILVDLPPGPPKKGKNFWHALQTEIMNGMNYAAGGLAKTVADQAVKFAEKRDEEEEEAKDHLY